VEDNWITCEIVRSALTSRGHLVLVATTGMAAVEAMANNECQVILLDLMLPDIDGAVLLESLRRLPGGDKIPILAFSAFVTRMEELKKHGARFDDYIAKPVEPTDLIRIIEGYLSPAEARPSS